MPGWFLPLLTLLGKLAALLPYLGAWFAGRQAVKKAQAEGALQDVERANSARNTVRGLDSDSVADKLREWQRD